LAELLRYASKLIYQTARGARALAGDIATNKVVSSFPEVKEMLTLADECAMDSPMKFSDLCKSAAKLLEEQVVDVEDDRHDYVESLGVKVKKGLQDE